MRRLRRLRPMRRLRLERLCGLCWLCWLWLQLLFVVGRLPRLLKIPVRYRRGPAWVINGHFPMSALTSGFPDSGHSPITASIFLFAILFGQHRACPVFNPRRVDIP